MAREARGCSGRPLTLKATHERDSVYVRNRTQFEAKNVVPERIKARRLKVTRLLTKGLDDWVVNM